MNYLPQMLNHINQLLTSNVNYCLELLALDGSGFVTVIGNCRAFNFDYWVARVALWAGCTYAYAVLF